MTPKERAAMQQALEALEKDLNLTEEERIATITALREALDHFPDATKMVVEQAEQEPVAWRWSESNGERWFDWRTDWTKHDEALRLGFKVEYAYAAPVRAKDLTDDEIVSAWVHTIGKNPLMKFARAVIAADREKNK